MVNRRWHRHHDNRRFSKAGWVTGVFEMRGNGQIFRFNFTTWIGSIPIIGKLSFIQIITDGVALFTKRYRKR